MESVVDGVPDSLYEDLSKKLVGIVLGAQDKDAVPTELAKKIIYLWRQDQLASPTGLVALLDAGVMVDSEVTYSALDELGLQEVVASLKKL
jgi:hypothetical protein